MQINQELFEKIKSYGVGRRKLNDELFANDIPPLRLGVFDIDDESLCHEPILSTCHIPRCQFTAETLLEFENHYNSSHRHACNECKKILPSAHLLELHVQENHDSFFAVMAEKQPSYCCYLDNCGKKFSNPTERLEHCVKFHKLPRDFRYHQQTKIPKTKEKKKSSKGSVDSMDLGASTSSQGQKKFSFNNSKQKMFNKYTGRKFTDVKKENTNSNVNMDVVVSDLKESLPSQE